MIAMGQLSYQSLGLECSGVVSQVGSQVADLVSGDRVCALAGGSFANFVRAPEHCVSKIPDGMSFAVAASIPIIFCTAYYSLIEIGRLNKGETVLIHAGAGGVGQAAIMIAQKLEAEIFTTVGSVEKKDFIQKTYNIPETHIFSSRDTTFEQGVLRATNNNGVDVVLNSVAGESLRLTWNCLAPLGRFVEIGKRDLVMNNRLEMEKFSQSVTYAAVDLGVVASLKPKRFQTLLTAVLRLHQSGAVQPVSPITTYSMSEVEKALRLMQSGKHMGKVVIEAQAQDVVQVEKPTTSPNLEWRLIIPIGCPGAMWFSCSTLRCFVSDNRWYWRYRSVNDPLASPARGQIHHPCFPQRHGSRVKSRTDRRAWWSWCSNCREEMRRGQQISGS